jgi:hypothetical protein
LRVFRRELTASQAKAALAAFQADLVNGVFAATPAPAAIYQKARQLSCAHTAKIGTRTLDLLHVAAVPVLHATVFYTTDPKAAPSTPMLYSNFPQMAPLYVARRLPVPSL